MNTRVLGVVMLTSVLASTASAQSPAPAGPTPKFQQIADGVYVNLGFSNTAVIVNEADVTIVDSRATLAAVRALVADIKTLTPKPVRYVINTHYHFDHSNGNENFGPDVQVIGHERTRHWLLSHAPRRPGIHAQIRGYLDVNLASQLEDLKKRSAAETDAGRKAQLEAQLAAQQELAAGLKAAKPTPPRVTYPDRMTLNLGGREIQLLYLGRGHTDGDTFVYLPRERVIITGDMMNVGLAGTADSYINDWPDTLEKLLQLDFTHVIPGHGDPFAGKDKIRQYQAYLRDLWSQAQALHKQGLSAEEARKKVDLTKHKANYPQIQGPGTDAITMDRIYMVMNGTP